MKQIIKLSLALCTITIANAQTTKIISAFNHIESVAYDGKYIYAADIGKELNPTGKDGDGKIFKLDITGKILDSNIVKEPINAPKGLAIDNGILFIADVDRMLAIEIKTGNKLYEIDFSKDASFLNDISVMDKNTIFISATDKSKIFKINLIDKSYTEIKTDKTIAGTNGLFYEKSLNRLYVNGFGADNKPNGIVGFVDLTNNKFTQLASIEGYFDGIWLSNEKLYISNWVAFEKKGIIQIVDVKTNKVSEVKLNEKIAGPADFIITQTQIIIPEMMKGTIQFINLN